MKVMVFFVTLVFMCSSVFAISGVSPSSYDVDFESGYSGEFKFNFIIDGDADLYIEGGLADYVSLDKNEISGREEVVVSLDLPSVWDSPGVNYIKIGARGEGVDVGGIIKVNVPYPERYVEVGLNAPSANVGETVFFELELFGKGVESVVVSPRIEVYKDGEEVDVVIFDDVEVVSGGVVIVNYSLDSSDYDAGDYLAVAFADYDDVSVSVDNSFRLGEFSVEVVDYTRSFRENKIGKFEILVESLWDDDIAEVYAEVNILGFDSASFVTTSESLSAWGNQMLVGFLDMSKVEGDIFEVEIVLHYDGGIVSKIVELEVVEGFDYVFWIVVLVVIVVLVLLVWRGVVFVRRFRERGSKINFLYCGLLGI